MSILELRNLTKSFPSGGHEIKVLQDVSLSLAEGESCAILGPSGSGKTTLLALAAGLDTPSEGTVHLFGHELHLMSEDDRAALRNSSVGFVFQSFHLIPSLTALENIALPAELLGSASISDINLEAKDLLAEVGLSNRATHYPSQLSGGEQQRVAIARAIMNKPKILFADEPTGNLDGSNASIVLDLLFRLKAEREMGLLCVTHDRDIAGLMDRSVELRNGQVVAL